MFSVRLEPIGSRGRGAGLQPVPQLRYGSAVMARSRQPDDILRALASVLGGAHVYRRDDGRLWMGMRPFVRGDSMVLVDVDRPTMVNDRQLSAAGVDELAVWSTIIEPDGSAAIPPPLGDLHWADAGIDPPDDEWRRFSLAGVVALAQADLSHAGLVADLARRSIQRRWFGMVAEMADTGRLLVATDRPGVRDRVRMLLSG